MIKQKMPYASQQTHRGSQKVSEIGKPNRSKNSLQQNDTKRSSEDSRISSSNMRSIDQRCAFYTIHTLESDGQWRIVAVPLQYFDCTNNFGSGTKGNMHSLHLVSTPPINSFKVDGPKTLKGPQPEVTHSAKPFRSGSSSGSNIPHQCRQRTSSNKLTKWNEVANSSYCHSSFTCNESSVFMPKGPNATNQSAVFIECSKKDNSTKRNLRKKAKKKGKHKKKQMFDVGSIESEVCSEYTHESSASENFCNNDINSGMVVSNSISPEISGSLNMNNPADSCNGVITSSDSPTICASEINEVDISESIVPSQAQISSGDHLINGSEIITNDKHCSLFEQGIEMRHPSPMGSLDGMQQKCLSNIHDSIALDSVSVGSNGEDSTTSSCIVKPFDNSHETSRSERPDSSSKNGSYYHPNSVCSISESHDTQKSKYGVDFSGCDVGMVASSKRGKQFKSVPGNSSTNKLGTTGNLHGQIGKDNSQSVWKRVQRNGIKKHSADLKKTSPFCSQSDVILKQETHLLKKISNAAIGKSLSRTDEEEKLKDKGSRKLKRKVRPALRQEKNNYSRKGSHPNKVNLHAQEKTSMQNNELLDVLTSRNGQQVIKNVSCSRTQLGFVRTETMKSEASSGCMELQESVSDDVIAMNNLCIESQDSLLRRSHVPLDQPNLHEVQSPVYLPHLMVNGLAQTEKEISLAENSKQNHSSTSIMQKWIPIGTKDPGFTPSATSASLSVEVCNGPGVEDWTFKSKFDERDASCAQNLFSSVHPGKMCNTESDSGDAVSFQENHNYISITENCNLKNLNPCISENEKKHNGADLIIDEANQNLSSFATDVNKIRKALSDTYEAQRASEDVQMATGGPIAEFERLLHNSSPVICHSFSSIGCQTYLTHQDHSTLLCRRETPNIPLGCLWEWYEKHGNYGLEIRAEDYENPKRFGVDQYEFRAYFVPYLSAVQLFRNSNSHSSQNNTRISSAGVSETSDTVSTPKTFTGLHHLPIFSALFPQQCSSELTSDLQENDVGGSEASPVSPKDGFSAQCIDITWSDSLEPVFEYFEAEQPQQRRALYEKIQELVRDDVSPRCKMYGDPAYLNSINMHELHPQSWYSVAWYPIYRIPDGNLRAAFLTYHSLGHLVHRISKSGSPDSCIVSPVVGLQSYSAQGECWFRLRPSTARDNSEIHGLNPSKVLKERLRTLYETASLMARGVVRKGNQTSVNRHPDYEFFLSRQRYTITHQ